MYFDWTKKINNEELNIIGKIIKKGEIIVFPTETVYGIGANVFDENAIKKIFDAKGRPQDNPLIVHVSSKKQIYEITKDISNIEEKLIDCFMPGPFTLILNKKDIIPDIVSAGLKTVGIRMPDNEISKAIIENAGVPIAAPSANISGKPSGTNINDIKSELENKVSAIIDGGQSRIGLESTVVKVIDGIPVILRPGFVTPEEIQKCVGVVKISESVFKNVKDEKKVESPGVKYKHYSPKTSCILVYSEDEKKQVELINNEINKNDNVVVMCFNEHINDIKISNDKKIDVGSIKNLEVIMKNIFSSLRKADKYNADLIIIEGTKKEGLGLAIMNRLLRACQYNYVEK